MTTRISGPLSPETVAEHAGHKGQAIKLFIHEHGLKAFQANPGQCSLCIQAEKDKKKSRAGQTAKARRLGQARARAAKKEADLQAKIKANGGVDKRSYWERPEGRGGGSRGQGVKGDLA